ncbi:MAG TPA: hypothetical protein VGH54_00695 [Mycobacterium sp.]|uniref:hypothetical protein n=1 Tax=Mycobacterium sp. TaxID=1785 RepID=UPI002F41340A
MPSKLVVDSPLALSKVCGDGGGFLVIRIDSNSGERLLHQLELDRGVVVYFNQMMVVGEIAVREGPRAFGATSPQQVVIWEQLMDAKTVLC